MPVLTVLLGVFGDKDGGGPQGVTLFLLDAGLALMSSSAGLGIGHTENVVGLDTAVKAAVSWNRVAELLSLVFNFFNSVEDAEGIFI